MFERIKQLDRQSVIILILAGVLGIFLFSAVTGGIRQAGWNEGYTAGLMTNRSGGSIESPKAVAPPVNERRGEPAGSPTGYADGYYPGYRAHGWGGHPFGFIGGFFRFLFFAFLIMMVFKFMAFRRWRMHGGPPWHHHRHGHWGQGPFARPEGQQPGQPQADLGSQPGGNPTQPTNWVNV